MRVPLRALPKLVPANPDRTIPRIMKVQTTPPSEGYHIPKILLGIFVIILAVTSFVEYYSTRILLGPSVRLVTALAALGCLLAGFVLTRRRTVERGPDLAARALQNSEKQFRSAFEFAAVGIAIVSPARQFLRVNRALTDMLGFTAERLLASGFSAFVQADDLNALERHFGDLEKGRGSSVHVSTPAFQKTGDVLHLRISGACVREINDLPAYFILHFENVTDRKRAEDRMLHQTLYDPLTDLPNRFLFVDRLGVALMRKRRDPAFRLTLLQIDFDRFKAINDRFGQQAGDSMLCQAAARLRRIVRAANTVARLGADKFSVFIEDGDFQETLAVVTRIRQELSRPYDLDGEVVYSSVSVGVAVGSPAYESAELLIRDADTALKHAKMSGRDRYEIFVEEMHSRSIELMQMESDLRQALERSEFRLYYQPIVTLEHGTLAGFESLVRWDHPVRGFVSPAEFIPLAESTGLIVPIGEWILRESCRQLKSWQALSERASDLWVSVNVSTIQFLERELVSLVRNVLHETGLEPRCLKLEITESAMVENVEYVAGVMQKLKELGVMLSIDDFGTGFSSLSILHQLPLDSLKIDRSFVSQIEDAEATVEIVQTIVNLARSMELEIIAEGVETIEQLSQLRRLGCEFGQGFCFAMPLDAQTIEDLVGNSSAASPLYYLFTPQTNEDIGAVPPAEMHSVDSNLRF